MEGQPVTVTQLAARNCCPWAPRAWHQPASQDPDLWLQTPSQLQIMRSWQTGSGLWEATLMTRGDRQPPLPPSPPAISRWGGDEASSWKPEVPRGRLCSCLSAWCPHWLVPKSIHGKKQHLLSHHESDGVKGTTEASLRDSVPFRCQVAETAT